LDRELIIALRTTLIKILRRVNKVIHDFEQAINSDEILLSSGL
jgi:hypothetical protein